MFVNCTEKFSELDIPQVQKNQALATIQNIIHGLGGSNFTLPEESSIRQLMEYKEGINLAATLATSLFECDEYEPYRLYLLWRLLVVNLMLNYHYSTISLLEVIFLKN